tara:strand:+ start:391 stop:795 length:405 start_codon:yes stop_codon:yes gene_type:complete
MSLLMAMLLLSSSAAKEPPKRPDLSDPVDGQCAEAIPLKEGQTAICRGVLLPTSWVADYELSESHLEKVERLYRLDTTYLEVQLEVTQKLLLEERKPVPILDRKTTWAGIGAILGSAAVIGGGYVIVAAVEDKQ